MTALAKQLKYMLALGLLVIRAACGGAGDSPGQPTEDDDSGATPPWPPRHRFRGER